MTPHFSETDGIIGDRRRNPFPSLTDTEYELFRAQMREEARRGAEAAITAHLKDFCQDHIARMDALEAVVFGRRERGIVGLDQRMDNIDKAIGNAARAMWLAIGAVIVAVVGIIISAVFGK